MPTSTGSRSVAGNNNDPISMFHEVVRHILTISDGFNTGVAVSPESLDDADVRLEFATEERCSEQVMV